MRLPTTWKSFVACKLTAVTELKGYFRSRAITKCAHAVAYLGFCEGRGASQRREVRGAGGANGVECGEGVSPPH